MAAPLTTDAGNELGEALLAAEGDVLPPGVAAVDDVSFQGGLQVSSPLSSRRQGFVPPPRKQGWLNAAAILAAELVGTGVLALPHTFAVVGWGAGLVLLFVFSAMTLYSGGLLWRLQQIYGDRAITYADLAMAVAGNKCRLVVLSFIIAAFFGNLAIYLLTCAEILESLFFDRALCKANLAALTAALLLPLCQLRTLHEVSFAAAFSAIAIFGSLVFILTSVFGTEVEAQTEAPAFSASSYLSATAASTTAIFAFGGQGLYLETIAEMRRPREFPKALVSTTAVILFIYVIVSLACYLRLGLSMKGNVLYALQDGWLKRAAATLAFLHVLVSYLLAQQVVGRVIHVRVTPAALIDSGTVKERARWFVITLAMLAVSLLVATGVPFFGNLMGIVGAMTTAPLTFGFPAFLYTTACSEGVRSIPPLEKTVLFLMVSLAIYLFCVGLWANSVELARAWSDLDAPFSC